MLLREGTRGALRNFIVTGFGSEAIDLRATQVDLASEWPAHISVEQSLFFMNGAYADETMGEEDDDAGFVEQTAIEAAERNNVMSADPMLANMTTTAPNYVPASAAVSNKATPSFG